MTKTHLAWALLGAALLAPLATAHGDVAPREIDTRVLRDANSLQILDYGAANGLYEDGAGRDARLPAIPFYEGGHDLMALDLREANGPDAAGAPVPGLYARLVFRRGDPGEAGITDVLSFTANGTQHSLEFSTADNVAYTSRTFTWVGPRGEPGAYEFSVEGFVPYAALGLAPGDELSGVRVESRVGGDPTDVMPGTYYYQGQYVPDEAQGAEVDNGPGAYTLAGPAALVTATAGAGPLDLTVGEATLSIRLATPLTTLDQFVVVGVESPAGAAASVDAAQVKLGNATPEARLTLTVRPAAHRHGEPGPVVVTIQSDLGAFVRLAFDVILPPAPANATEGGHHEAAPDGNEEGHDHDEETPAPGLAAAALALLAAAARRRARR